MPLPLPFAGVDRRTAWLRATILTSSLLGLLSCVPLWSNTRLYPLFPIAPWIPILPAPWDAVWFGLMLSALVLAAWFYRTAVTVFLAATLYAYCEDQTRGQPWLYLYWMLLLFTLFPASVSIAACRGAMSVAYIWSGVQKINPRFFKIEPAWFVQPASNWHLPATAIDLLRWSIAGAPFIEFAIGVGLWISPLRRPAIVAVIMVHAMALLFLGPLGHNYNFVVWPWNLAMIALVLVLFMGTRDVSFLQAFAQLRQSRIALGILLLYSLLPALSFVGWWDSYFSFALYAENSATANIFITPAFVERLPPPLKSQVLGFSANYDPDHQGPLLFTFQLWCRKDLGVPFNAEPRIFHAMFLYLRRYAQQPEDLRMIIGQRAGPVIFYQGDERQYLAPAK